MPRLIDADALVERLKKSHEYHARTSRDEALLARDIRIIKEQPTIDAEPVRHGTWETSFVYDWDGNKLFIHFHRECGFEYRNYLEDEQPYCPHCGVKMDGGRACGTA